MNIIKIIKESIQETIEETKQKLPLYIMIAIVLIVLATASYATCHYIAKDQCQIIGK